VENSIVTRNHNGITYNSFVKITFSSTYTALYGIGFSKHAARENLLIQKINALIWIHCMKKKSQFEGAETVKRYPIDELEIVAAQLVLKFVTVIKQ